MFTPSDIKRLLFSSDKKLVRVLEVVQLMRIMLEDSEKVLSQASRTLDGHYKSLVCIRQLLKKVGRKESEGLMSSS